MQYHGQVSNLFLSAILYALPFFLSHHFWWLIFLFPVLLLYTTRKINFSFIHGYVWGCAVFTLHTFGWIYLIATMAGESWAVGLMLGIALILYQALFPAFLFFCVTKIVTSFSIHNAIARLCLWTIALWLFIVWVDWYSFWIFGVQEGYPLMHPLIVLVQKPELLWLLPIVGKQLLTALFLLVPMSITALLWYRNWRVLLFLCIIFLFFWRQPEESCKGVDWSANIKTLSCMICSAADDPTVIIKIIGNHLKKMVAQQPEINIIIMPESACDISNFAELSELLQLWNSEHLGRKIHIIFGASRYQGDDYYNALHWVHDGILQHCYDKKHAMLLTERLPGLMNNDYLRSIYFSEKKPITVSSCKRTSLALLKNINFVPYICSELFFNELPDDYSKEPIIAIANDLLFAPYIQKLLVLLARFKAIQWQRNIIYVSYAHSLFIDDCGGCREINE
jgi:hypothetical protein